jgi:putative zinc finger/helix-turn-helix YgiT family protein
VEGVVTDQLICPTCGNADLRTVAARRTVRARDGRVLPYRDTLTACRACGERFYTHEQALASDRSRASAVRHYEGLLTPSEIRAIREGYGLTQDALERLLRVGPKTVVRWERGTVCQSAAVDTLLAVLRDEPAAAARLAARAGISLQASPRRRTRARSGAQTRG